MAGQDIAFDIIARDKASDKFDKVGRSSDGATGSLKKFAKVGALAVAGAAVVAGKALFDMTKAAIEDEKSQALLANTLRNTAKATADQIDYVERWITKQGVAKGVADDELRPALQRLAEATGDVDAATELSTLAMDISAGTGKSLKTVSEALAKAYMGNVGALSRYGIKTRDAKGEMMTFDDVVKKASKTFEGQATTAANTLEGKMGRLRLRFDEAKETLGSKLIPIVTRFADFLMEDAGPAVARVAARLQRDLGPAFTQVGDFIVKRVIPAAREFHAWFVGRIAPGLQRAVKPVLDGIRSAFSQVSRAVDNNRPAISGLLRVFRVYAEFMATVVLPLVGKTLGAAFKVFGFVLSAQITVISRLVSWVRSAVNAVKDLISAIKSIPTPKLPDLNPFRGMPDLNPLNRSSNFRTSSFGGRGGGGGDIYVTVNGALDPTAVAAQVVDVLKRYKRQTGANLGLA